MTATGKARPADSDIVPMVKGAIEERVAGGALRSDTGPEFIAQEMQQRLRESRNGAIFIDPGRPLRNPKVESFHSRLRDGWLNREIFHRLLGAMIVIGGWTKCYNREQPYSGIGYKSPIQIYHFEPLPSSSHTSPDNRRSNTASGPKAGALSP